MLRFIARVLGSLSLAVALVYAVGDIARTLADDLLTLTSVREAGETLGLPLAAAGEGLAADLVALLSPLPVAAVLAVLALVLIVLGQPRRRRRSRTPEPSR